MRRSIFILLFLMGCSGYRFTQQDNPLSQYGIQCLSMPMFYNYSNFADASAEFTKETYRLFTGFSGLKLKPGYDKSCDAVFIGIIKTPEKMADSMRPTSPRVAKSRAKEALGAKRENFYIPGGNRLSLNVHVIVIKRPTEEELALLRSSIGDKVQMKSKIVFNEIIPVQMNMTREIFDDPATDVVATQNLGVQRKTMKEMSVLAATSIRDLILYAF